MEDDKKDLPQEEEEPGSSSARRLSSSSSSSSSLDIEYIEDSEEDEEGGGGGGGSRITNKTKELVTKMLDLSSPTFCPLLALRFCAKGGAGDGHFSVTLPVPDAPTYLNLQTYDKAVPDPSKEANTSLALGMGGGQRGRNRGQEDSSTSTTSGNLIKLRQPATVLYPKEKKEVFYPIPGRRFLPHQLPTYQPREEKPDVMKTMETIQGPLYALRLAMKERRRIKVWTRKENGIRGYLTGFIEAFDKHWNLALRDVDEVFYRKKNLKSIPQGEVFSVAAGFPISTNKFEPASKKQQPKSPTKRSKRIAEKRNAERGSGVLVTCSSDDIVNLCRTKISELRITSRPNVREKADLITQKTSKSYQKKHDLTLFSTPKRELNGFHVIGTTKKLEIVERHVGQLFVMGNDVVFVETMPWW